MAVCILQHPTSKITTYHWSTRQQLIEDGIGTGEKEEQSYRQAARQATAPPSHELAEIIARTRLLAKEN